MPNEPHGFTLTERITALCEHARVAAFARCAPSGEWSSEWAALMGEVDTLTAERDALRAHGLEA